MFCHATNSFSNPYKDRIETSIDTFSQQGHSGHTGPQFPEMDANGKWGDIYPPIPSLGLPGQNWDFIGQSIWNNNCRTDVPVTPVAPMVHQAICTGPGTATNPTLDLASTPGIVYTIVGTVAAGQTVQVVASADPPQVFKLTAAPGWTLNPDGTASYSVTFDNPDCIAEALPAAPTVQQGGCTAPGVPAAPTLALSETQGIVYTVSPAGPYVQGQTVTVTATPAASYKLGSAAGWSSGPNGTASMDITFVVNDCIVEVTPLAPTATPQICTGPGTSTAPSLTWNAVEGITYSNNPTTITPGIDVVVTATANTGYKLGASNGWTISGDGKSATYTVAFEIKDCTVGVAPEAPVVTKQECTGPGTSTGPILELATTEGITYSTIGSVAPGNTVIVKATANPGYKLTAAANWALESTSTATFTVQFDAATDCIVPATPGTPTVTQAVCTGPGTATTPTLEVPQDTDTISYTTEGTIAQGNTVYVIATPAFGHSITAGNGWNLNTDGTATFTVQFITKDCTETATPLNPTVVNQTCPAPGVSTGPTLTWTPVEGITYSNNTDTFTPGGQATVTATANYGYTIGAADQWTVSDDGKTATFTVTFSDATDCIVPATPGTPTVTQAGCTGPGTATTPTLEVPQDTDTISYTTEGTIAQGNTVYVIATPAFGHSITLGDGWELDNDGRAVFRVEFVTTDCIEPVTPPAPTFENQDCTAPGTASEASLKVTAVQGISYSYVGTVAAGNTVTVTATADPGYRLVLPGGFMAFAATGSWTMNDDGTASFTVTFGEAPDCIVPTVPAAPTLTQAVCTGPGTATTPTLEVPENTDTITYTTEGTVSQGNTVLVIATPAFGHSITLGDGWELDNDGRAVYTATFDTPDCIIGATPTAPVVEQQVCTGPGASTGPSMSWTPVKGISYTNTGTVAAGNTVTVTATPDEGYTLELQSDLTALAETGSWIMNGDGTASYTVTFDTAPDCTETTSPTAPTFTQAVCTAPGEASLPTLTLPKDSTSVKYMMKGTIVAGKTATVIATPATGYGIAETEGWTLNDDGTASYTVTFNDAADCIVEAAPVAPGVAQAVCTDGKVNPPTMTLASTKGITYASSGNVANGETVNVTATAASGYSLSKADGWTASKNGTAATYVVTFETVACPVVVVPPAPAIIKPAPVMASPAPLARTGLDAGWNITLSVLFLILGAGAVWRSRRPSNG